MTREIIVVMDAALAVTKTKPEKKFTLDASFSLIACRHQVQILFFRLHFLNWPCNLLRNYDVLSRFKIFIPLLKYILCLIISAQLLRAL